MTIFVRLEFRVLNSGFPPPPVPLAEQAHAQFTPFHVSLVPETVTENLTTRISLSLNIGEEDSCGTAAGEKQQAECCGGLTGRESLR